MLINATHLSICYANAFFCLPASEQSVRDVVAASVIDSARELESKLNSTSLAHLTV